MNATNDHVLLQIVIPTYRRAAQLDRLLASLVSNGFGASAPRCRILVSENGGSQEAEEVVARYGDKLPISYMRREFPLGMILHYLFIVGGSPKGEYLWVISDDEEVMDIRWDFLCGVLEKRETDIIHLEHKFKVYPTGEVVPPLGGYALEWLDGEGRFTEQFMVENWHSFALISASIIRTDRLHAIISNLESANAFLPLEVAMRVGWGGGKGLFLQGNRLLADDCRGWDGASIAFRFDEFPKLAWALKSKLNASAARKMVQLAVRSGFISFDGFLLNRFFGMLVFLVCWPKESVCGRMQRLVRGPNRNG